MKSSSIWLTILKVFLIGLGIIALLVGGCIVIVLS